MTKLEYILIFVVFALLLSGACALFVLGLYFSETNTDLSVILYVGCGILAIAAFVLVLLNYKKLTAFDNRKLAEKLKDKDYTCVDCHIDEDSCRIRLKDDGYWHPMHSINILYEKVVIPGGDSDNIYHYYVKVVRVDGIVDINEILVGFNKGLTTYNAACIYIDENIEENLTILKEYIKQSILDNETHPNKYKCFFAPLIFTKDKVYYLKAGSVFREYRIVLKKIINILGIEK